MNGIQPTVDLATNGNYGYGNGFFGGLLGDPVNTIQNLTRRSSQGKVIPVYVGKNFSHSIEDIIAAFHRNGIR